MGAKRKGGGNSIRFLAKMGVEVLEQADDDGNTPLHKAAGAGHAATVWVLVENGAN